MSGFGRPRPGPAGARRLAGPTPAWSHLMSIRGKLFDACAAALILVGTGVLTLLWDGNARAAAESSLLAGSTRYVAYFITRAGDCRSHVESIRTFERSELRERVRLGAVVLLGNGPALRDAQSWLAREYPGVRVLRPRAYQRRYLRELGFRGATP